MCRIINYSQEFKDQVRKAYPDSPDMAEMLENGNPFLGRYLDDSSQGGISPDTILLATSLEEIQSVARNLKIKRNLYAEYWEQRKKFGVE